MHLARLIAHIDWHGLPRPYTRSRWPRATWTTVH